jgi:hypothetical protein
MKAKEQEVSFYSREARARLPGNDGWRLPRSELSSHSCHTSRQQAIIHSYSENNNSPLEGDKGVN